MSRFLTFLWKFFNEDRSIPSSKHCPKLSFLKGSSGERVQLQISMNFKYCGIFLQLLKFYVTKCFQRDFSFSCLLFYPLRTSLKLFFHCFNHYVFHFLEKTLSKGYNMNYYIFSIASMNCACHLLYRCGVPVLVYNLLRVYCKLRDVHHSVLNYRKHAIYSSYFANNFWEHFNNFLRQ